MTRTAAWSALVLAALCLAGCGTAEPAVSSTVTVELPTTITQVSTQAPVTVARTEVRTVVTTQATTRTVPTTVVRGTTVTSTVTSTAERTVTTTEQPEQATQDAGGGADAGQTAVQGFADTGGSGSGCVIKGNINSKGEKIYHVPGGGSYEATVITESKGERWFCSEEEAVAAGWRKARN